jgi:hypothetical protein
MLCSLMLIPFGLWLGVPRQNGRRHAAEIATMALDLLEHINRLEIPHLPGTKFRLRTGCHSGKLLPNVVRRAPVFIFIVPYRCNRRGLYVLYPSVRLSLRTQCFPDFFFAMYAAIALKLCIWLCIYDLQIKFEDDCYRPIFGRVMPLHLSHFKEFYSFPHLFALCLQIFI